jgi:hypothetical protein
MLDLNDDLLYGKKVGNNTVRFEEICSIPLTNLISKFLRDLVAAGKSFSLELKLDDTPDAMAQVGHLLKESRHAYKYSDRLSLRQQDEHVRSEFNHMKHSIFSKSIAHATGKAHQRLVVEDYQLIPEDRRDEIEQILTRSRARDSYRILDNKTGSENPSVMESPSRSRFDSGSHGFAAPRDEPISKPSTFNLYKNAHSSSTQMLGAMAQRQARAAG